MPRANQGPQKEDRYVVKIKQALEAYRKDHARATVDAYRQNPASIRVRVVDPDFKGLDLVDRDSLMWTYLDGLPDEVQAEISMLVLVTPQETKTSMANLEFEDPIPSAL